jgi:hypothetical protein
MQFLLQQMNHAGRLVAQDYYRSWHGLAVTTYAYTSILSSHDMAISYQKLGVDNPILLSTIKINRKDYL